MKAKLIVEGKEFDIDILDPKLQELIAPKKKTGYEKVKTEKFYFVNCENEIDSIVDEGYVFDSKMFEVANYYSSKEVAENNARADNLMRQLRRFAVEHRKSKIDWTRNEYKYTIRYAHTTKKIECSHEVRGQDFGGVWFDSEIHAKLAIETFHDELMWYFTEYKDSL